MYPNVRYFMVSTLGAVIMSLGIYSVFGHLDPQSLSGSSRCFPAIKDPSSVTSCGKLP